MGVSRWFKRNRQRKEIEDFLKKHRGKKIPSFAKESKDIVLSKKTMKQELAELEKVNQSNLHFAIGLIEV